MDDNNIGTIKISEEVIASIALKAAGEIEGVAKVHTKVLQNAKNILTNIKQTYVKGINISTTPEGLELSIQISVKNGSRIPDVASNVQSNVTETVQNMTGLTVHSVNVVILSVLTEKQISQSED